VRVLVTGASGYVGSAVQQACLRAGYEVRALSRSGRAEPGAIGVSHDILSGGLEPFLAGVDAVIHLVGIIREVPTQGITFERLHVEASRTVAEASAATGVPLFVQMSALGTGPRSVSRYFATKYRAEEIIRDRLPMAVIVRPSLVFGGGAPFFATLRQLARQPVVPVPGPGTSLFDPLYRKDLAQVLAAVIQDPDAQGTTLELGGPRRFSLDGLIDLAAEANGRALPVPKMHVPLGFLRPVVAALDGLPAFPLTRDQLAMLNQPNITEDQRWHRYVATPVAPAGDL
jgi:uncharacterized protein YbjT (DUF2867 family)